MNEENNMKDELAVDRKYISYLQSEVENSHKKYNKLRLRNERYAITIRFLALLLSAVVTIILGLNLDPSKVWNGIALTLSAMTGVVSGFSSFFDFNALAIKFKDTQDKLNLLRIKMEYLEIREAEISTQELDALRDEYLSILGETYTFYQSVKKEDSEEKQGKRFAEASQG